MPEAEAVVYRVAVEQAELEEQAVAEQAGQLVLLV